MAALFPQDRSISVLHHNYTPSNTANQAETAILGSLGVRRGQSCWRRLDGFQPVGEKARFVRKYRKFSVDALNRAPPVMVA